MPWPLDLRLPHGWQLYKPALSGTDTNMLVDKVMTSVHAVAEVLHVLATTNPALSHDLFRDLVE